MKKNLYATFLILGIFFLCLTVSNCGKEEEGITGKAAQDAAGQLIKALNKPLIGLTVKVDPANISTKPSGANRLLVTFKNPAMSFNTGALKKTIFGTQFKEMEIPVTIEEVTYLYGPEEKYLEAVSLRGMAFHWDAEKLMEMAGKDKTVPNTFQMDLKLSIKKMDFKNYILSSFLTYEGDDFFELLGQYIRDCEESEGTVENIKYEAAFTTKEQKNMGIIFEMDKMHARQKAMSDFFLSIYRKDAPVPDVAKLIQEGKAVFDVDMTAEGMKVTVKEGENLLGGGSMDSTSFAYFIKPDEAKTSLTYGFGWKAKNLKLSIPDNPVAEMLGNIKEMDMSFSMENLSPEFAKSYLEMMKGSMNFGFSDDAEKMKQQQQQQAMKGMALASQFVASKPVIKMAVSPFKHSLGELSGKADFQFVGMQAPVGKAEVKILKVNDVLNKLKEEKMIAPEIAAAMEQTIKKMFVVGDGGDGSLIFEIKADQPGKYFLNGKPMK